MRTENVLREARFDPKLVVYFMVTVQVVLLVTVIGIPLMPLWLLFGWSFHKKQLERMQARLTDRSLNLKRGVLFRVEKNVPLEKITDLTMKEGPLLRWLGLTMLHVETAGQAVAGGGSAHLFGLIDAAGFRDAVLDERDKLTGRDSEDGVAARSERAPAAGEAVLAEIRDSLHRIERLLEQRARA